MSRVEPPPERSAGWFLQFSGWADGSCSCWSFHRMGREARQGAIGLVIDRDYLEIGFPLEATPLKRPKGKKGR